MENASNILRAIRQLGLEEEYDAAKARQVPLPFEHKNDPTKPS